MYRRVDIPNFTGYQIDTNGDVWSYWTRCVNGRNSKGYFLTTNSRIGNKCRKIKLVADKNGYLRVNIIDDNKKRRIKFIHRLILEVFVPKDSILKRYACHNDGNCQNNILENLRWDTQKGNMADKKIHGTNYARPRLLSQFQVQKIRLIKDITPCISQKKIAGMFNVSQNIISKVLNFNY